MENEIKINIEANDPLLGGHAFEQELTTPRALGILGSVDANRCDPQDRWDTDQFHNSVAACSIAMLDILCAGVFTTGGFNFDAQVRRQSVDAADLFNSYIGGIDTIARDLQRSPSILEDGRLKAFRKDRCAGWEGALGQSFRAPDANLSPVDRHAIEASGEPERDWGRQK